MKKLTVTLLILWFLAFAFVLVTPAFALQEGPSELTLSALLMWIAVGPGAAYLTGILVTHVLENVPVWHKLPASLKFTLTLVIAGGLPILAQLVLGWPGLPTIEPWINTAITAIILWISSQASYIKLKKLKTEYKIVYGSG